MGLEGGDRIEAAVKTTLHTAQLSFHTRTTKLQNFSKENLSSEENMQNNRVEEMNK